jgi:hypothetical protein
MMAGIGEPEQIADLPVRRNKEVPMATVKEINVKGFCDAAYTELSGMKKKILDMRDDLAHTYGAETKVFGMYERHLRELADQIEWKLQILSHACPFDWKGSVEYAENIVSVGPAEKAPEIEFSGGYLGG